MELEKAHIAHDITKVRQDLMKSLDERGAPDIEKIMLARNEGELARWIAWGDGPYRDVTGRSPTQREKEGYHWLVAEGHIRAPHGANA